MNPQVEVSAQSTNPLLEKVKVPGRIFQLPSAGILYKNGELADNVENGEVHVYPMTALDEIHMKNPDMLFSGKAISIVFRHCIPDIKKPEELFAKDIDAIMVFLRNVTYGQYYEIEASHTCEGAKNHSYMVDVEQMVGEINYLDAASIDQLYTITLANGQVVKLQPIRYKHVLQILKMNENKKELSVEDQEKNLITNLLNVIDSVDGFTDKKLIAEWARAISPQMMNTLAEAIDDSQAWGVNTVKTLKCKDCGEEYEIEIPINPISFFFD